jgi:molybdopterin-guanine dinucleotide biosynthesis protein A
MLAENELSVYRLFPRLNVRYVEVDEIERFDPERKGFFNINTENDLRLARDISGGGDPDD